MFCAQRPTPLGQGTFFLHGTSDAKIGYDQASIILVDEQIRGLDVAMHNILWMRMYGVNGIRQFIQISLRLSQGQGLLRLQQNFECATGNQRHHQEENRAHFADMMEDHLARRTTPKVVISDERAGLLDSGGGIAKALPLLGPDPFFVANIDIVWIEGPHRALQTLAQVWDPERMDICILLAPRGQTYGYERPEGFVLDDQGHLAHSNSTDPLPPYNNLGMQIMKPGVVAARPVESFSIVPIWKQLSAQGRLHGAVMDGYALHVSDPQALAYVEAHLR